MMASADDLRFRFVAEGDLTPGDHAAISDLLVVAFPKHADVFRAASCYPAPPDHRLWMEDPSGAIVAHLGFERRLIGVGERDILVAGVGGVATHPGRRGKGLGRRLMAELRRVLTTETSAAFGYLGCREEVVGFYERVGWHRVYRKVREMDLGSMEWTLSEGPTLIMPATKPLSAWPREGTIDLRGMWW
ncbi:MAG: GNAT family N-acetyltransferase [Rubrobacter sp.]|nr:GNAT family N-acetyltransferase [Rubrobacter sp.]